MNEPDTVPLAGHLSETEEEAADTALIVLNVIVLALLIGVGGWAVRMLLQ